MCTKHQCICSRPTDRCKLLEAWKNYVYYFSYPQRKQKHRVQHLSISLGNHLRLYHLDVLFFRLTLTMPNCTDHDVFMFSVKL